MPLFSTDVPLADLLDDKSGIVHSADGRDLDPEYGGPARTLVPYLHFRKPAEGVWRIGGAACTGSIPGEHRELPLQGLDLGPPHA